MMKHRLFRAFRGMALVLAVILLCAACNIAAFTIDTPDMRRNAWQGSLMLREQLGSPQTVGGFMSSQLDNFTAVLILKTAAYTGEESLLAKAAGGYRVDMPAEPGQSEWDAFCNYVSGPESPTGGGMCYARYWHGYTLPLRLLLCVLDVANLQMVLYFAQLALLCLVLCMMKSRGLGLLIPGFFLSYFLLMPFSMSICLQYVPVSMLMLIACVLILRWDEDIARAVTLPAFFAVLGVLTNYLDLLTFPMVSLGFPLVLLLALRMRRGEGGWSLFLLTALCGCSFALGYGGMWALKWIFTGLVFGWHSLWGIFTQITLRSSSNGGEISRIGVLMENLNVILAKKSYLLLIGLSGLLTLLPTAKALIKIRRMDLRALNLLLPAAAVAVWYLVMANHSYDHTYFTYRNAAVMVFAGFAFIACLTKRGDLA